MIHIHQFFSSLLIDFQILLRGWSEHRLWILAFCSEGLNRALHSRYCEFFFDTQAGLLNFIGETIPSTLTAGESIFVIGYRYVGLLGVTNLPDGTSIGNLQITGNTIVSLNSNGDIVLDPNGTGNVRIVADTSVTGNITTTGEVSASGNVSGNYILGNGSQLTGIDATSIQNGT